MRLAQLEIDTSNSQGGHDVHNRVTEQAHRPAAVQAVTVEHARVGYHPVQHPGRIGAVVLHFKIGRVQVACDLSC